MIPQTLTIKGLYSYQKEQHIDFRQLMESRLFGIFGSVGSGKSTILEAITFALYGETDRLNNRDNRNYNMMNLKSDELLIDFVFNNHDGETYRFTVQGKRNKNDFDNVKTYHRKAYQKSQNQWLPIETSKAEEITGLSYENFRRTIIIPQGKFQEFLQLTDKERTQMMKELFNLEKFEFFHQVSTLESQNKEKTDTLKGKLEHYDHVSHEALEAQKEEVEKLNKSLQEHSDKLQSQEEKVNNLEDIKKRFEDFKDKEKKYNDCQREKPTFETRKKKLQEFESAQQKFQHLLQQKKEKEEEIKEKEDILKKTSEALTAKEKTYKKLQQDFQKAEKDYEQLEQTKNKQEDLQEWISVLETDAKITGLEERIEKGEQETQKLKQEKEKLEQEIEDLDQQIDKLKSDIPDQQTLLQLQDWFTQKNTLNDKIKELKEDIDKEKEVIEKNKNELQKSIPKELGKTIEKTSSFDHILETIAEYQKDTENKLEEIHHELEHLQIQNKLKEFTTSLEQGKPCPLCGAEEHPDILNTEDVETQQKETRNKKQQLQDLRDKYLNFKEKVKSAQSAEKQSQERIENLNKRLQENKDKLDIHVKNFSWEKYQTHDEQKVADNIKLAKELSQKIRDQEKKRKELEQKQKKDASNVEKYENELSKIKDEKIKVKTEKDNAQQRIKTLSNEELPINKEQTKEEINQLAETIEKIEKRYKELQDNINSLKNEIISLSTQKEQHEKDLKNLKSRNDQLNEQIESKLKDSDFDTIEEVKTILQKELDIQKEREAIDNFYHKLYAAEQELNAAKEKIKDTSFDEETYNQAKAELAELKKRSDVLKEKHTTAKNTLDELHRNLEFKEKMQQELKGLEKRAENLKTMKKLFTGSGFVNYVSSVFLHNLCETANKRFTKLTRQQLQLEIDENNNFRVRDFLNNGRTRSIKTLSGGQTFQASLSLALALAESVQKQAQTGHNFFFLDEGFGTLDKDSLQIVFDTLKSLRHENRIVGVISHVEEMQQEIDMFIRVKNDDEQGSIIQPNWK